MMCARQRTSLSDIAQQVGVSVSTVSRALKQDPRVATATRRRIEAEARKRGYLQRGSTSAGRQASTAETGGGAMPFIIGLTQLGLVVHGADTRSFFSESILEFTEIAQRHSFRVGIHEVAEGEPLERACTHIAALGADALVLFTWDDVTEDQAVELAQMPVPVVLINRCVEGLSNAVTLDNFGAGIRAARYLHRLGHRRMAYLPGPQASPPLRDRLAGFRAGLEWLGCHDPALFAPPAEGDLLQSVRAHIIALLQVAEPPTAVWAFNDWAAGLIVATAQMVGLEVPGSLSVMGFDNRPGLVGMRLTTFDYRCRELARQAVHTLEGLLRGTITAPVRVCVPPTLVEGATTASPPDARHHWSEKEG